MNYKEELKILLEKAYTPYYKFPVSAILVTKDGKKYKGVNVEVASPNAGICAERNALTTAITDGYKKGDFKELYVMTKGNEVTYPCFICRQALLEFFEDDVKIILLNDKGLEKEVLFKDLVPYSFSNDDLK
ncbi:MAG: cytidine deaminase [Bacilli bacterium]